MIQTESLLHWVWQHQYIKYASLHSIDNQPIQVKQAGFLNPTDGPDFKRVCLIADGIQWHGHLEIHIHEDDWFKHKHHQDLNYDNVIAHVFLIKGKKRAINSSSIPIPLHIDLSAYLDYSIHQLLHHKKDQLACTSLAPFSRKRIAQQLNLSSEKYFYHKVEQIRGFWPAQRPIQQAFIEALSLSFFDFLGVSHNREQMIEAYFLLKENNDISKDEFIQLALNQIRCNKKAIRPANRAENRLSQAYAIYQNLNLIDLHTLVSINENFIHTVWTKWVNTESDSKMILSKRLENQCISLVLAPSIYFLGTVLQSQKLKEYGKMYWSIKKHWVPETICKQYERLNKNGKRLTPTLGMMYQKRYLCDAIRCQECLLYRKEIF